MRLVSEFLGWNSSGLLARTTDHGQGTVTCIGSKMFSTTVTWTWSGLGSGLVEIFS
jgi:hypothetical protein